MIAVLVRVDGFGYDTQIYGIFPTLESAKQHYRENFYYQEFEFGEVNFDIDEAKEASFEETLPKKKKRR